MSTATPRRRWYDSRWKAGAGIVGLFLLLGTAAIGLLGGGIGRPFNFPSTSMEPALRAGEQAFADMSAYTKRDPERGDVVVFRSPQQPTVQFVKRIVGMPGERLHFASGGLHINGTPVQYSPASDYTPTSVSGELAHVPRAAVVETLLNGRSYHVLRTANGYQANDGPVTIPAGHYFLAGDFRDNSRDSRGTAGQSLGLIPRQSIEGRFTIIYWPSDWSRLFSRVR